MIDKPHGRGKDRDKLSKRTAKDELRRYLRTAQIHSQTEGKRNGRTQPSLPKITFEPGSDMG